MRDGRTHLFRLCILTALIGVAMGNRKGRALQGLLLGLLLSVIGLVIIVFLPVTEEMKIRRAQEKMRIQAAAGRAAHPPPP